MPPEHFKKLLGPSSAPAKLFIARSAYSHPGALESKCSSVSVRAEKTCFLRRVQASRTGPDPPRQFFRSQIRVLKKNLHKLRFANRNPTFWTPFLEHLFSLFLRKNTKKYPNILMREMIKMIGNWSFAPPALQGVI